MYSLILNSCVPHSQYVGSFGPYDATELSGQLYNISYILSRRFLCDLEDRRTLL